MATVVWIENPDINEWYTRENQERDQKQQDTLLLTVAYVLQMGFYYNLWDDAVDNRDSLIEREKQILDYMINTDETVDYPFMQLKQEVLSIPTPSADMCGDNNRYVSFVTQEGNEIDDLGLSQANHCCGGLPDNWSIHEGILNASKAQGYAGSMLAASGKRRTERFRMQKTDLVLRGQASSSFNPGPMLSDLHQAIGIQEGLASIFAAGFNSAGVGLGTVWGQASGNS